MGPIKETCPLTLGVDVKKLCVYIDTSVFGGYFDEEFERSSKDFFGLLTTGHAAPLMSDTLVAELTNAPNHVQDLLAHLLFHEAVRLELSEETLLLRDAYLTAGVLSLRWSDDALHVAHATVARADVIVSWNFKHLVNPVRIRGFDDVNEVRGYRPVIITTPADLVNTWSATNDNDA